MKTNFFAWVIVPAFIIGTLVRADDPPSARPSHDQLAAMVSSLKWQTGSVPIKDGLAKINLTPEYRFLGPEDARKVLHNIWNNPDDPGLLGMIFPKDKGPLDREGWAVTINYENGGYVKDNDADSINYDELLKTMQKDSHDATEERHKQGYPAIDIVGWAAPPRYDKAAHKLYWAKELKVEGEEDHTLNYDIRILGRRGVLVLGAIAAMPQLDEIKQQTPQLLSMVDFQPGNTYAEFDPKVDKVAEYGLAALVAGGALAGAAKLGLFGLLFKYIIVAVVALKKLVIVIVVAIVAGAKKLMGMFTRRSDVQTRTLVPPPDKP